MSTLRRSFLLLVAGAPLVFTGCIERQTIGMTAPGAKSLADVAKASEDVLRSHYYQVKRLAPQHLVALTPVELVGSSQARKRIDVWIWLENGFFMPNVFVEASMDDADPSMNESRESIAPRFPIEKAFVNPPKSEWRTVYYDRTLGLEIRNAILDRLGIREPAEPKSPALGS